MKKIIYLILILGFIGLILGADYSSIYYGIRSISKPYLLGALLLQIITMGLLAYQWKSIGSLLGKDFGFLEMLSMNSRGNIVDSITPGSKLGGEMARLDEIKRRFKLDTKTGLLILSLQKCVSISSFLILVLLSFLKFIIYYSSDHVIYFKRLMPIFLKLLGPVLLASYFLFKFIGSCRFKESLGFKKVGEFLGFLKENSKELYRNRKGLVVQMVLGLLIWIIYSLKLRLIVRGFYVDLDMGSLGMVTYLSYILAMIPLLPGSIGSFEASMTGFLKICGIGVATGLKISIVFRFVTFWFEFIVSILIRFVKKVFTWKDLKRRNLYGRIRN